MSLKSQKFSSHEIVDYDVKPTDQKILEMIEDYFSSQADEYDQFDENLEKRKRYNGKIDQLVREKLKSNQAKTLLSIACGTGKREIDIQNALATKVEIHGLDLNPVMCKLANERGIECQRGTVLSLDLTEASYDAIAYLHAFGHVPSRQQRSQEIEKIYNLLTPGGVFCVDLMNLDDENEWGPNIKKLYEEKKWSEKGLELGDIFYKRVDLQKTSFFHYFSESEIVQLLTNSGFESIHVQYVGYAINAGQEVKKDKGAMFVTAIKTDKV
ncbi:MAG: class I SAM-dependent methyltransferase [Bdellovibrionales bacterium]|nr:class I SAM-dependent methyltransferase [Bdellovibrionales bacterium]